MSQSPSIWFPYLDLLICSCGVGFLESMLEPHAREEASMSHGQVGFAFLALGVTYMLTMPVAGHVRNTFALFGM